MVSDVFMKVCKDQKQFEHTVPLFRLRLVSALFQILDDRQRIRQQPLKSVRINRAAFTAAGQCLIRADKSFIHEMIEAQLRARQRLGN